MRVLVFVRRYITGKEASRNVLIVDRFYLGAIFASARAVNPIQKKKLFRLSCAFVVSEVERMEKYTVRRGEDVSTYAHTRARKLEVARAVTSRLEKEIEGSTNRTLGRLYKEKII